MFVLKLVAMKIHILSDLHTEFTEFYAPDTDADVVVLVGELEKQFDGPTVIVTHHLPASTSIAKRYANDPLNPAFASKLEGLIETHRPELWIHGHTHVPCDYELFETRIACNPRGYPGEASQTDFRADLVVTIA